MKNKMFDLRNHLFETLELLKAGEIEPSVAKSINEVAKTINDTAITELKYLEAGFSNPSNFIQRKESKKLDAGDADNF